MFKGGGGMFVVWNVCFKEVKSVFKERWNCYFRLGFSCSKWGCSQYFLLIGLLRRTHVGRIGHTTLLQVGRSFCDIFQIFSRFHVEEILLDLHSVPSNQPFHISAVEWSIRRGISQLFDPFSLRKIMHWNQKTWI